MRHLKNTSQMYNVYVYQMYNRSIFSKYECINLKTLKMSIGIPLMTQSQLLYCARKENDLGIGRDLEL